MPAEPIPFERRNSSTPAPVKEVHIVWLTAGLSCDGDSVSVTAAEQPSIEDVVLGAIPGLPKVYLHNPVLAYENGDDFMKFFYQAERGEIDPFVLVVEGSIPNEQIKDVVLKLLPQSVIAGRVVDADGDRRVVHAGDVVHLR